MSVPLGGRRHAREVLAVVGRIWAQTDEAATALLLPNNKPTPLYMDDEGLRGQTYRCSRTASEGSTGNVLKISASGIVEDEHPIEDVELWLSYQIERC